MPAVLQKQVRLQCEQEAWSLCQRLWSQERIAEKLGVTQGSVSRMLARVERRTLVRLSRRVERTKARQTAQLETIASEAFEAWLVSKSPQVIERKSGDVSTVETRSHQCDPSLLGQVRGALADIRGIWGLDAPVRSDVTGGGVTVGLGYVAIVEGVRPVET